MGWEAVLTLAVVGAILALMIFWRTPPDFALLGGLTVLLVAGVLTAPQALAGMANDGMITVGVLYIVVAGIRETGGINWIVQTLLGVPKSLAHAQLRLMLPVAAMSAVLNNTPVVAMLIPATIQWAKRHHLPVSKLLMPLSYAAILGGTCTLIGTSTNLVISGMMNARPDLPTLYLFDIAWVGLPCALVGVVYIMTVGRFLLPDRQPAISSQSDPREYTVEMLVEPDSPLVGKTIEQAGLRNLPSMFLVEIDRGTTLLPAVSPHTVLAAGDRLVFAGIVESVVDLQRIRGLTPATEQVFKLDAPRSERTMIEAVVSNTNPLIGKTIRRGRFRSLYNAVVIAAAREGERINKKIGDIVLQPGDMLLLEAHPSFTEQYRHSRDFLLLSQLQDAAVHRHERGLLALLILIGMVAVVALGFLTMLKAAMVAAGLMLITRCCSAEAARRSVDWSVLLAIAASFGIGQAMMTSGAAGFIADNLIAVAGGHPLLTLAVIYLLTTVFTELLTNNAAAVLMFPIALASALGLDVNFVPFAITIMMGASASFSTPIGYQCNLMVYGPGGYRFTDYTRVGLPLNILLGVVTVLIAPLVWPF